MCLIIRAAQNNVDVIMLKKKKKCQYISTLAKQYFSDLAM